MQKNLRIVTIGAALFFAAAIMITGCNQTVKTVQDTTAPAEVTELKAENAVNGKVSLSWNNPGDADLYQVEISAEPAEGILKNPVYLAAEKDANSSFVIEGLTNGTAYTFIVKTLDKSLNRSAGVKTEKPVIPQDTSDKTAPAEVMELKTENAVNGKISLSWKNPADDDLYQVEISAEPAAGSLKNPVYLAAAKGTAGSYIVTGLTNGTGYSFTVKTIDMSLNKSAGAKTENPIVPVDTSDKTPPAEITELSLIGGNGKVSVSWKNPADEDLHQVEITANPANGSLKNPVYLAAAKGTEGSFIAEGLQPSTKYTFTLKTIDASLNKSAGVQSKPEQTQAGDAVMSITLTQSPAEKTNGDVTVTVTSSTSIKEAKWLKGAKNVKEIFASGTLIDSGSFEVSENGMYSVAVLDNDGRREVETIEIKNIDKESPVPVTGLAAVYSAVGKTITVSWKNPSAPDFAGLTLKWKKEGGNETEVPISKGDERYEITGIESDGGEYTITVKAKDDVGNESGEVSASITTSAAPSLTGITLNRAHLAYNDSDLTITATLTISNDDLIASQSDSTVKVGIFDGDTLVGILQSAAVVGSNYTATLTAPRISESQATAAGKTYTVKVKLCGTYASLTETFILSQEARLSANPALRITKIASNEVTPSSKTQITIRGVNLDVAGEVSVQLYDSTGTSYGSPVSIPATTIRTRTTLTADIPVPTDEGVFTAKLLFGGTVQTSFYEEKYYHGKYQTDKRNITHPTIQVYGR